MGAKKDSDSSELEESSVSGGDSLPSMYSIDRLRCFRRLLNLKKESNISIHCKNKTASLRTKIVLSCIRPEKKLTKTLGKKESL